VAGHRRSALHGWRGGTDHPEAARQPLSRLLSAIERSLAAVSAGAKGPKAIALRVGQVIGRFQMSKHFRFGMQRDSFPSRVDGAFRSHCLPAGAPIGIPRSAFAPRPHVHVHYFVERYMRRELAPMLFDATAGSRGSRGATPWWLPRSAHPQRSTGPTLSGLESASLATAAGRFACDREEQVHFTMATAEFDRTTVPTPLNLEPSDSRRSRPPAPVRIPSETRTIALGSCFGA